MNHITAYLNTLPCHSGHATHNPTHTYTRLVNAIATHTLRTHTPQAARAAAADTLTELAATAPPAAAHHMRRLARELAAPGAGERLSQADACGACGHTRSLHSGPPRIGEDRTGCTGPLLAECDARCAAFVEPTHT